MPVLQAILAMIIFKGEKFIREWSVGEIPDTLCMTYLKMVWKKMPPQQWDHYTPGAISRAAEERAIVFTSREQKSLCQKVEHCIEVIKMIR